MDLQTYLMAQLVKTNGYAFRPDADERLARQKKWTAFGKRICALIFWRKKG